MDQSSLINYKFGAGRYFQESGVLSVTGTEAARLGRRAYIFGSAHALAAAGRGVEKSLAKAGVSFETEVYAGFPTLEKIESLAQKIKNGFDVIIGAGGGRIIDASKAAAGRAGVPVITVPTTAATCAAFTPISLCYTEDGRFDRTLWLENEVAAVVADTNVLAAAPARYLAAGILDSMAKYVEIANGSPQLDFDKTPADRHSAYYIAEYIFNILKARAKDAVRDAGNKTCTKLLNDVFFINIALTGMVSGMTRGKGQTAAAHAFYNGIRRLFCAEARDFLHGEIVAVGLLSQYAYNSQPERVSWLRGFVRGLGAPASLSEIGVAETEENLSALFDFMKEARFMQAPNADEKKLRASLEYVCGGAERA